MTRGKSAWTVVFALAGMLGLAGQALAFRSGPPSGRTGSTDSGGLSCTQCHGAAAGSGSVQILGVPTNYAASTLYNLTVRIADPVQAGAGFEISVEDATGTHVGTLVISDATNTRLNTDDPIGCPTNDCYASHTSTGVSNAISSWAGMGNAAEFNVDWTSPASDVGTVTFWAAGNAINNNFSSSGDTVYLTNETSIFEADVPALSTWGLVVLTLVMLIAASVLLGTKGKAAHATL